MSTVMELNMQLILELSTHTKVQSSGQIKRPWIMIHQFHLNSRVLREKKINKT